MERNRTAEVTVRVTGGGEGKWKGKMENKTDTIRYDMIQYILFALKN